MSLTGSGRSQLRRAVGAPDLEATEEAFSSDNSRQPEFDEMAPFEEQGASNDLSMATGRNALRYTQELPVLSQIFAQLSLQSGRSSLRSSSLHDVSATLEALIETAISRDQADRLEVLLAFQEQLSRVPSMLLPKSLRSSSDAANPTLASIRLISPAHLIDHLPASPQPSIFEPIAEQSGQQPIVEEECPICFEAVNSSLMESLSSCESHHRYCLECMSRHFSLLISEADLSSLSCPHPSCDALPTDDEVRQFAPQLFENYLRFMVLAVLDESTVVECHACGVTCVIEQEPELTCDVAQCPACAALICMLCKKPFHPQADCENGGDQFSLWLASMENLVKSCPVCERVTEKNLGCNHMTCKCGDQWCWYVQPAFSSHLLFFFRFTLI